MRGRLSILWHYARAARQPTRWRDRASLERWHERQVRRHLARVAERSPFFGRMAAEHGVDRWREWPVLDKAAMMRHFDEWNTAGIRLEDAWELATEAERTRDFSRTLGDVAVGLSSGTSGSRGLFLASGPERRQWAGTLLARILQGTLFREHRAALFLRADSPLYGTVGSRRFSFEFFDLVRPLEEHVRRLRDFRPTVLAAPPRVLVRLADHAEVRGILAAPALLVSVADVLDPADRTRIESGFGRPVGQIYQATEGFLAATCPHGSLHWNEDAVVVEKEWLDDGRLRYTPVITDFRRSTQPIVRYRLDDVIVDAGDAACPCGSIFGRLEAVEGRRDDVLRLPRSDGAGSVPVYPDFVRRALVLGVPPGVEYTVRQTSMDRWLVALSPACPPEPIEQAVRDLADRLGALPPTLDFVPWEPRPLHEKLRRVRCELPAPVDP